MRHLGIDIGTGNIVCAEKTNGGHEFRKVRDAFFKVDPESFMAGSAMSFGEKMLKRSGANYIKLDGKLHILGDDAFKFAHMFHRECLRPMAKGVLNPKEPINTIMVRELLRGVVGQCDDEKSVVYFCSPANPIDADFDVTYHATSVREVLVNDLGYKNVYMMTEGLSVVYSELEKEFFTGIGVSFGAGMTNITYSCMGIPIFSFSVARSGDWIDTNAAEATNETANVVQAVKEKEMNINAPEGNTQRAIASYYHALLTYVVQQFNYLYKSHDKKELPNITEPIVIAVAGGTSKVNGFKRVLKDLVEKEFPLPVGEIRLAEKPL